VPDFAALDVALGLIFVFLVLSLVCSALMETLSSILAWRAAYLKKGLVSLLDEDLMNEVFDHPLVNPLVRPARELSPRLASIPVVRRAVGWWRRERYPSYLPSRTVIAALLDLDVEARAREAARTVDDAVARVPNERVREALTTLWRDVKERVDKKEDQLAAFRKSAETWYDDTMARVSGWYRRRVQLVLWCIAITLAVLLNVDSVNLARVFWSDETVRAAVVAQAERAAEQGEADGVSQDLEALEVPLGWSFGDGRAQDLPSGWQAWLAKVIGILLTSAAISLGAPFWFDLLGKVAKLRSSGSPPPPRTATEAEP
jgi:hypothetical protein